jgi:hypothetical protein
MGAAVLLPKPPGLLSAPACPFTKPEPLVNPNSRSGVLVSHFFRIDARHPVPGAQRHGPLRMCNPRKECRCISVGALITHRPALGAVPSCETEKGCGPHDHGTATAGHRNAAYENTAANGRGSTFRDGTIASSETLVVTTRPGRGGRRRPVLRTVNQQWDAAPFLHAQFRTRSASSNLRLNPADPELTFLSIQWEDGESRVEAILCKLHRQKTAEDFPSARSSGKSGFSCDFCEGRSPRRVEQS